MNKIKVLVGCEFSQVVTHAFRRRGHEAFSCDVLPTEGNPEWHIQGDVRDVFNEGWDLAILHPPCTYLTYAATRHWNNPGRAEKREEAMKFFMEMIDAPIKKIAVENPVGYPNSVYRKPDQIIQPYYFGDAFQKRTCLWLKNLPLLTPSKMLPKPEPLYYCQGEKCKGKAINWCEGIRGEGERWKARSKTFPGIADAMADQWGSSQKYEVQSSLECFI